MSTKTRTVEKNGNSKITCTKSVWSRAFTANSEWPDKVSFKIMLFIVNVLFMNNYILG